MKFLIATLGCASVLLGTARAQVNPTGPGSPGEYGVSVPELRTLSEFIRARSTSSRSGQFVIYTPSLTRPSRSLASGANLIALEPRLLAVSCERIKQSLLRMFGASDAWRGKIYITLQAARSVNDSITLIADKQSSGWMYRLGLPNVLEQDLYVRTIVDVLLLEMANRNAGSRSAEIPAWLAEGLAQELLAVDGAEFILPPPDKMENGVTLSRLTVDGRRQDPLARAQNVLRSRPPLTFEQLSWPSTAQLSGDAGEVYRSSAQLFVDQLLILKNGPGCFCDMLDALSRHYNWQFAFLNGFHSHFRSLLEVEKWWALQLVHYAGRDLMQVWTPEQSWKKLDEIVRSQVEVRSRRQELPLRTEVTLQMVIREWDLVRQTQMFQRKLNELNLLRPRVAQNLVALVDDYRAVVGNYLQKRGGGLGRLLPFGSGSPISDRLAQETIKQLDALDARRAALRPVQSNPVAKVEPSLTGIH